MDSASEALHLVKHMNDPQFTSVVPEISKRLQRIQLSPEGWTVADSLLSHNDNDVKFYGALTFQVKLNRDGKGLHADDARGVLERLLSKLIEELQQAGSRLVQDKLCSTLATYFIQSNYTWKSALRQLVCSFSVGEVVSDSILEQYPSTSDLLGRLEPRTFFAIVRFCHVLIDDVTSAEGPSLQHGDLDEALQSNVQDLGSILVSALALDRQELVDLQSESITTFEVWASYAHSHWRHEPELLSIIQGIALTVIHCLVHEDDDVCGTAMEVIALILDHHPKLLTASHMQVLLNVILIILGPHCLSELRGGERDATTPVIAGLVTAFGRVKVVETVQKFDQENIKALVELLFQMLTGTTWPSETDQTVSVAIEFWNDYAEYVVDTLAESDSEPRAWLNDARATLIRVTETLLLRIYPPSAATLASWDEGAIDGWNIFRDDVFDFVQKVILVPDTHVFELLGRRTLDSIENNDWAALEAVISCLVAISDEVVMDAAQEATLQAIMGSGLFDSISASGLSAPLRTQRAVMKLVDSYSSFVESHAEYLPSILSFLLHTLANSPANQTKLSDAAAKSLEVLCSACRRSLTFHVDELIQQCPQALAGASANAYQKEKVMSALASVIEAMPVEEAKIQPLLKLIGIVEDDLNRAMAHIRSEQLIEGELLATTALQCLASIGKSLQDQSSTVVDLETDEDFHTTADKQIWTGETGLMIHSRIIQCFGIISYLTNKGDAMEAAFAVLRSGLAETLPGPFVFEPELVAGFIINTNLETPRVEAALTTACAFVSAYSRHKVRPAPDEVSKVYATVSSIMLALVNPQNDPQVAQLCVDFLDRMTMRYGDVILRLPQQRLGLVLQFVLDCFTGEAPMLKRAASAFLTSLIELGSSKSSDNGVPAIAATLDSLSPHIARALMNQVGGYAQRSELDAICKVLKSFIFTQPLAKRYVEEALTSSDFPSTNASLAHKRTFLQKLAMLRGGRQTNVVVKEFWALCKGTVDSYE